MNFKSLYSFSLYSAIVFLLVACGTPADENDSISTDGPENNVQVQKNNQIQKIFATIPSQSETTTMLEDAGARYNAKALNPVENLSKYSSVKAKALNLGVYGIDLGVTNIFDQTQESMLYLRCTNKMATSLGISGAFDENMSSRLEANSENKDSLLAIITDSYRTADEYLQENGQPGVSTIMVVGAWIEGMYISSQIALETSNDVIVARIVKEKTTLNDLIALLESYKAENEGTEDIIANLKGIKEVFDGISENPTLEQFKPLADKVIEVRSKII
ncbi:MAG: hypothetical protein WBM13_11440 [Bacteroidia bacterium]